MNTAEAMTNTDEYGWFLETDAPTEIVIVEYRIVPSSQVYIVRNRVVSLLPSASGVEMVATRIEMQHPNGAVQAVAKPVNGHTIIEVDDPQLYERTEPEPMDQFDRQRQHDCIKCCFAVLLIVSIVSAILSFV